jgi:leader peptidase (prepilin peptidase)/N-methyltransferase
MNLIDDTGMLVYLILLVYSSVVDYKKKIIYDKVHLMLILLAFLICGCNGYTFALKLIGATFISIPFLIVAMKTNQLGGGDVKFIFSNSMLLGFWKGYIGILIGLAAIIIIYLVKWRKENNKRRVIPMAPFLSIGFGAILLLKGF